MNKQTITEFTSWMTAKKKASRTLAKTGDPQAIFYVVRNGDIKLYRTAPYYLWKVMKPGTLGHVVQRPDPMFDGLFRKAI